MNLDVVGMLNQRQRAVLIRLIEAGAFVPVSVLAAELGISDRAARYDLETIEVYLKTTPFHLQRHKQKGVHLAVPEAERSEWLQRLRPEADVTYRLSPQERRQAILAALLRRSTPMSLGRLADELFVSRRTLVEDLKQVEQWLRLSRLELLRLPRGLVIRGDEAAWRRALAGLLDPGAAPMDQLRLLAPAEMELLRQAVLGALEVLPVELSDAAQHALIFHLAVAVMRLRGGHDIRMDPVLLVELRQQEEWRAACQITDALGEPLQVAFPEAECGYIALHLLGAKPIRLRADERGQSELALEPMVAEFVGTVGAQVGVDLSGDEDLHHGLLLHLRPALYRLRFGLRLVNPLKEEIRLRYGHLMDAVAVAVGPLERELLVVINEDEQAFLAMHVGASLERMAPGARPRALLVCGSGIGTARLLQSRLNRAFPDLEVVAVLPMHKALKPGAQTEVDLVVATLPMPPGPRPVVVVNPFLTPEDVRQLRQALTVRGAGAPSERMIGPVLADVLTPSLIKLDLIADDWEQAIRLAGEPLVAQELVEPRFVEAMVQTVRRIGPYIVLDRGVAMPHARPEDGALALGFSFVRLAQPVRFGHDTNDPVNLIFCLAAPDGESHLRALQQLAGLLSNPATRSVFEHGSATEILATVLSTRTEGR